jgi:hypothetical protein
VSEEGTPNDALSGESADQAADVAGPGGAAAARRGAGGVPAAAAAATAIIAALIVGVAVWLIAGGNSGGGGARTEADVSSVIAAFSQGSDVTRYEGQLPPGYPKDVPTYPGARLVSSILQVNGNDVAYLAVYDTSDKRAKVSAYFGTQLSADPWQVDMSHDGLDSTIQQFTKIDDANIAGLVLAGESKQDATTTIIYSVQVTGGAAAIKRPAFSPPSGKALPAGYPGDTVPQYAGSTIIESGFQKQSGATTYQVSFVTKDDAGTIVSFYKDLLGKASLTVADGDASQSTLKDAQVVTFTDAARTLGGQVTAGAFAGDELYTRIDVAVTTKPAQ